MDGTSLVEAILVSWKNNFGVVSQDSFMFNASIYDNIRFGKLAATNQQVEQAAEAAHAHEFVVELDDGYETIIGDRGYRLSGGQIQRLALARAIVTDASILVLDEATSALDSVSEKMIMSSINELRGNRTIVMVAHRLSTVVGADQILMFQNGRIIERGTHEELISKSGNYNELWRLQTNESKETDIVKGETCGPTN